MMPPQELHGLLRAEVTQRREEGCAVDDIAEQLAGLDPGAASAAVALEEIAAELAALTPPSTSPYEEPSDLDGIRALRPDGPRDLDLDRTSAAFRDRMLGAWLGRSAGCLLGKPVEGWPKDRIDVYLHAAGDDPLEDYCPAAPEDAAVRPACPPDWLRGNITLAPRDDDLDYTLLGVHILRTHGPEFTSVQVGAEWLARFPYHRVYTAERVAYRNLVLGLQPPATATYLNPYREWIGAQIRADGWAYGAAGSPERAAEYAFKDAALSHTKNGIYGEMFFAAVIAASFVTADLDAALDIGLSEIPAPSRLAECVADVRRWHQQYPEWTAAWDKVNEKYGHYHGVHTINNAACVLLGLLYGDGDFTRTISIAVRCGWDTDCNGATAGSVLGAMLGADALPQHWVTPLHNVLESAVQGYERSAITELAEQSVALSQTLAV